MNVKPDSLEDQLERLKHELAQAREEAEQFQADARSATEELHQFVYAASHDLQEPLRSVRTYAQLLEREHRQTPEAAELVNVIIDGANTMDRLLKDLLTYSRSGASPQLTPLNLQTPLQWALLKLADPMREARAQVTSAVLPEVYADERQMASVFEHLLSNAIKYSGAEPPRVHVTSEEGDEFFTVEVRDNGEGVAPEYHEQIFVPFKRLHGKKIAGSGLGLSICRKILRAHRGSIWIESDGKAGSAVKFTLPV